MFKRKAIIFLYTEAPVHWGTGSHIGAIDLPVQRERHTGYPMGQGAGIKGSIRDFFERSHPDSIKRLETIFGPLSIDQDQNAFSGSVSFGDAKLVLFPIRSLKGTFAYATSRLALERLARDAGEKWSLTEPPQDTALVPSGTCRLMLDNKDKIILEESLFTAKGNSDLDKVAQWLAEYAVPPGYWAQRLREHLVLLPETDFQYFVRTSTIVETHVKISSDTGTVENRALFQAEYVPSDSIFYVLMGITDPFGGEGKSNGLATVEDIVNKLKELHDVRIQTGGDATTGRGLVRLSFFSK